MHVCKDNINDANHVAYNYLNEKFESYQLGNKKTFIDNQGRTYCKIAKFSKVCTPFERITLFFKTLLSTIISRFELSENLKNDWHTVRKGKIIKSLYLKEDVASVLKENNHVNSQSANAGNDLIKSDVKPINCEPYSEDFSKDALPDSKEKENQQGPDIPEVNKERESENNLIEATSMQTLSELPKQLIAELISNRDVASLACASNQWNKIISKSQVCSKQMTIHKDSIRKVRQEVGRSVEDFIDQLHNKPGFNDVFGSKFEKKSLFSYAETFYEPNFYLAFTKHFVDQKKSEDEEWLFSSLHTNLHDESLIIIDKEIKSTQANFKREPYRGDLTAKRLIINVKFGRDYAPYLIKMEGHVCLDYHQPFLKNSFLNKEEQDIHVQQLKIIFNFIAESAWKDYAENNVSFKQNLSHKEKSEHCNRVRLLWITNLTQYIADNPDLIKVHLQENHIHTLFEKTEKLRKERLTEMNKILK